MPCVDQVEHSGSDEVKVEESTKAQVEPVMQKEAINDTSAIIDVVTIYGTAVIEDSLQNRIDNEEINSVIEVIDSKDHLRRNIDKISLGRLRNFYEGDSKYRHEIEFVFAVRTSTLWESPRAYLWKHLGTSEWTLRDGRRLSFVKIHRK